MDKNAAMDRRFSLNMTNLPNPIAESTIVNLNGTTNGVLGRNSASNQFRWGGSPISPKTRSNSSICLNSSSAFYKNRSTATSPQRTKLNLSKIDPRTYADVQSRGLVSRIIQYHESGSRLNRSKSTSNLCSKSGQSSMVQLQKTDLPYRATQQNVSMTRIIPPKKSIFYGNTLSSLLRSNSVISIQKSDEEISSENRPILHPPPTENELAPTRSVLDVLKEISRKRINSDESDGIHDVNKKYCSREINDTSYEQSTVPIGVRNMGLHTMNTPSIHVPSQSFKRQREQIVTPSPHSQNLNSTCGATFPSTRLPLQTQHSPEQIAKKRLCSYNNDITSSLSSSLIHANKRKFYEQQRSNMQRSPPSATEEYETQKSKMHRQQSDLRFQQLTQSLSCNTPITPIPTTPLSQSVSVSVTRIQNNTENGTEILTESGGIVKRTVSDPPVLPNNQTQKPKVTLFNRNYNESSKLSKSDGHSEEKIENTGVVNDDECADIQFVKPKKSSSIVNKKNPFIERTQKSKLAMMLSGLRGEIYQGEEGYDDVDKISNESSINTTKENNVPTNKDVSIGKVITSINSTATTITTNTAANFTMKTSEKSVITSSAAPVPPVSDSDKSRNKTTITSSSSIPTTKISILSDFKLSPSVTLTNTTSSINASPTISTTITATKAKSPLIGLKLTPQKPTPTFGSATGSSAPAFDLNTTITTTTSTASATVPQLQGFSLGTLTNTTSTTAAPTTTTTAISSNASAGGFKFGLTPKTEASTTVTAVSTVSPFGSFGNTMTPTSKPVSSETAKPASTFGRNDISTSAAIVKPTFNFGGSIAAPASTASTTTVTSFPASSGTLAFGGATISTTSVEPTVSVRTAQSSNVFGSIGMNNTFKGPTEVAAKPFAFGTTASTAQSTSSTTATPATSAFSFGGATVPTANTGPPTATANNLFAFGGQKSTAVTTAAGATFAFGGNKTAAVTTSASTNGNVNKPAFSFGPNEQTAVKSLSGTTNTTASSGNLFAFGGSSTTAENKIFGKAAAGANNLQAAGTNSIQTGAFTFGAATGQGVTSTFDAVSTAASAKFAFGATTTSATSTPFAFCGSNTNKSTPISSTGVANNTTAGGFSFGASTAGPNNGSNTPSTNIFGAATPASIAATSITKPAFNFGGATSTTESTKSIFGGSATNTNVNVGSNNNTFGALAGVNNNQTNKTFNFGGANTSSNNASSNLFTAAGEKAGAGGFSFSTSTMGNKPATTTNTTPFAFGGGTTNGSATATAVPFSFGSSSGSAPANKTFSFGSTSNAPATPTANANSIFGGAQQTSAAAFSFSTGTSAPAAPSTVANIFAPPAAPAGAGTIGGGAATTDRPIRRATRRLQKT